MNNSVGQGLKQTTTEVYIFEFVDKIVVYNCFQWENYVSIYFEGSPVLQGRNKDFVAQRNSGFKIYSFNSRSSSQSSRQSGELHKNECFRCFMRSNANHKLLYHTEVRWLSEGKVLKVEIISFIDTEKGDLVSKV